MSKALSKSLGTDLAALAQVLRSKGRRGDTVLAHITPKEAALLKRRGGSGSINPDTGLPEYFGEDDYSPMDYTPTYQPDFGDTGAGVAPSDTGALDSIGRDSTGGFDMSQYAGQPQPTIDSSVTGEGAFAPGAQDPATTPRADPSTYADPNAKPWYQAGLDKATSYLSDPANLAKLGLLGGLGLFGAKQGQTAAQQGAAATGQIAAIAPQVMDRSAAAQQTLQNIAQNARTTGAASATDLAALGAPARDLGTGMMTGAVSGNLTPANQASLAALKARAEQDISKRGGVGAMQAGVAEESAQAQLAQQQLQQGLATYQQGAAYSQQAIALQQAQDNMAAGIQQTAVNTALQQAGIADQYTINAIMTGLQMDQATAQSLKSFYTSLAQVGFGQSSGGGQMKFNPYTGAPVA
jgi:hypothetical protein